MCAVSLSSEAESQQGEVTGQYTLGRRDEDAGHGEPTVFTFHFTCTARKERPLVLNKYQYS